MGDEQRLAEAEESLDTIIAWLSRNDGPGRFLKQRLSGTAIFDDITCDVTDASEDMKMGIFADYFANLDVTDDTLDDIQRAREAIRLIVGNGFES